MGSDMIILLIKSMVACFAKKGAAVGAVNSPMYDTYMTTPGHTAKPRATDSTNYSPSLVGSEPKMH